MGMGHRKGVLGSFWILLICGFGVLAGPGPGHGFWLDQNETMELKGKVQTRLSVSTESTSGFTFPEMGAGEIVQHRNIAYTEFNYLPKHSWKGVEFKAHFLGRFLYEGIYDYGPQPYQDVRDANKEVIDDFKMDAALWEGYGDFGMLGGRLFFRIGLQNLSWGETDFFRIIDQVNPLDNTWGGIFEDLDDRRIPLNFWRVSYNLGTIGPISNATLEGYLIPGFMENRVAPSSPYGTRYAAPAPASAPIPLNGDVLQPVTRVFEPEKTFDYSRYGIRHCGVVAENFNYSLAYVRFIPDAPAGRAFLDFDNLTYGTELFYDTVDLIGASLSFYESHIDTIVRSEIAYFFNEPVFIPSENLGPLLTFTPGTGTIPEQGVLRFVLGLDKQVWIRALNPDVTFTCSVQWFGTYYPEYTDEMIVPLPKPPEEGTGYVDVKELESQFTALIATSYLFGQVNPQVAFVYDPQGTFLVQPGVNFIRDPWRLNVSWATIFGNFAGIGVFRDRDQAMFTLTYVF